jgi:uncharacterized membrane protein
MEKEKNKKIMWIVIILLLLVVIVNVSFYLFKNNKIISETIKKEGTEENNKVETNTKVSPNKSKDQPQQPTTTQDKTKQNLQTNNINEINEVETGRKIQTKLNEWDKNKNKSFLKEALKITGSPNNEAILNPWGPLVKTNSSAIFELTKEATKEELLTIFFIFEWFVEGSGDFENISIDKKIEIKNQYFDIKRLLERKNIY